MRATDTNRIQNRSQIHAQVPRHKQIAASFPPALLSNREKEHGNVGEIWDPPKAMQRAYLGDRAAVQTQYRKHLNTSHPIFPPDSSDDLETFFIKCGKPASVLGYRESEDTHLEPCVATVRAFLNYINPQYIVPLCSTADWAGDLGRWDSKGAVML